mmetsp:Transcript_33763/g.86500  ORF Transcript_33763/g.86500 Transcript_33763/m.86500 type:complete len:502 (+) Transcript_33763:2100-3605(+)
MLASKHPSRVADLRHVHDEVDETADGQLDVILLLEHQQPLGSLLLHRLRGAPALLRELLDLPLVLLTELGLLAPVAVHHLLHLLQLLLELFLLGLALGLRQAASACHTPTTRRELLLELLDLSLQPRDLRRLLVLCRRDLDRLRAVRVAKCRHSLLVVASCGRQGGKHGAERVAAEGLLQHARELRVAVRDENLLPVRTLHQRVDHIAQGAQTLVDICTLLQRLTCRTRALLPLGTGQVHEVELGEDVPGGVLLVLLVDLDGEDGVGARAGRVHHGGRHSTVLDTGLQHVFQLGRFLGHDLREVLYVDTHHRVLLHLEAAAQLATVGDRVQEVEDDLVVDLEVRAHHEELACAHLLLRDVLKQSLVHARDDADQLRRGPRARHTPALAAASLPIRKNRPVVALERLHHRGLADRLIDGLLLHGQAEDNVEGKRCGLLIATRVIEDHLASVAVTAREGLIHLNDATLIVVDFFRAGRPTSDCDLHAIPASIAPTHLIEWYLT